MAIAPTPKPIPAFAAKGSLLLGPGSMVPDEPGLDVGAELIVDVRDIFPGSIILQWEHVQSVIIHLAGLRRRI